MTRLVSIFESSRQVQYNVERALLTQNPKFDTCMSEFIIIAGPQAAGKSTVIQRLTEQYQSIRSLFPKKKTPLLFPLQESRQIVVHKYALLGAIFMTAAHEEEVVQCDLARMDVILERRGDRAVYLDECNVFTTAHAAAHGILNLESHFEGYAKRLRRCNAKVVFIDVPSEESWLRRLPKYEARLIHFPYKQHVAIMRQYREYLKRLRPLLLDLYDRIELPKELINGCVPEDTVVRETCQALTRLSTSFQ